MWPPLIGIGGVWPRFYRTIVYCGVAQLAVALRVLLGSVASAPNGPGVVLVSRDACTCV